MLSFFEIIVFHFYTILIIATILSILTYLCNNGQK